jgi:hypothetical protein
MLTTTSLLAIAALIRALTGLIWALALLWRQKPEHRG